MLLNGLRSTPATHARVNHGVRARAIAAVPSVKPTRHVANAGSANAITSPATANAREELGADCIKSR